MAEHIHERQRKAHAGSSAQPICPRLKSGPRSETSPIETREALSDSGAFPACIGKGCNPSGHFNSIRHNWLFIIASVSVFLACSVFDRRPFSRPALGSSKGKAKAPSQRGQRRPEPYKTDQSARGRGGLTGGSVEGSGPNATGKPKRRGRTEGHVRYLACPCFKFNPIRHLECLLRNNLSDTSFVVQHLVRRHPRQPIHCPVCGETFDTRDACDNHVRHQSCVERDFHYEGLKEDQVRRLHQNRRNLNEVDRWYCLWDIIYPNTRRPESPYVGDVFEEMINIARRAWRTARESLSNESPLREFLVSHQESREPFQPYNSLDMDHIVTNAELLLLDWQRIRSIIPNREDLTFLSSDFPIEDDMDSLIDLSAFMAMNDSNQHQPQGFQQPEEQMEGFRPAQLLHVQPTLGNGDFVEGNPLAASIPATSISSEVFRSQISLDGSSVPHDGHFASFVSYAPSSLLRSSPTIQETNLTSISASSHGPIPSAPDISKTSDDDNDGGDAA